MKKVILLRSIPVFLIAAQFVLAQKISVNMQPEADEIESILTKEAEGETIIVEFIGSELSAVSGYQFKVSFDSSKFDFLGGDEDYGLSGEKNILKSNGGSLTGIFQVQNNPECDTILDVAYTINGEDDLSVSGDGLLGVAQFKSKVADGDSGTISVSDAYWVNFAGEKSEISDIVHGLHIVDIPVNIIRTRHYMESRKPQIHYLHKAIEIRFPESNIESSRNFKGSFYRMDGRCIQSLKLNNVHGVVTIPIGNFPSGVSNEMVVLLIQYGGIKYSYRLINNRNID